MLLVLEEEELLCLLSQWTEAFVLCSFVHVGQAIRLPDGAHRKLSVGTILTGTMQAGCRVD